MSIDGINNVTSGVGPLRLIRPVESAQSTSRVVPAQPIQKTERALPTDTLDFEAVYRSQLPSPALTHAHQRLEKLRELVAARTNVPINFEPPVPRPPANPYAASYSPIKFPIDAAAVNERATEADLQSRNPQT